MPTYDFRCDPCGVTEERTCMIAERESQVCGRCGGPVVQLFTPTTNISIPQAFAYAFSDLYGTSSEKEYVDKMEKAGTPVTRVNRSTFKTKREQQEAKWAANNRKVEDMERTLMAQGKLKKPRAKKGDKPVTVA